MTEKAVKLLAERTKEDIRIRTSNTFLAETSFEMAIGAIREATCIARNIDELSGPDNQIVEELIDWLRWEDKCLIDWWEQGEQDPIQSYEEWRKEARHVGADHQRAADCGDHDHGFQERRGPGGRRGKEKSEMAKLIEYLKEQIQGPRYRRYAALYIAMGSLQAHIEMGDWKDKSFTVKEVLELLEVISTDPGREAEQK